MNHPEQEVELLTPDVRFVLSSAGGTLKHAQLLEEKYRTVKGDPTERLRHRPDRARPATRVRAHDLPGLDVRRAADGAGRSADPRPTPWSSAPRTTPCAIEKRYRAESARYRLHLDVTIENKTAKPGPSTWRSRSSRTRIRTARAAGSLGGSSANTASVLCYVGDKTERTPVEKLAKETVEKVGNVRWIGADEKFFLLAAVPFPETPPHDRTCTERGLPGEIGEGDLTFAERELAAAGKTTYSFALFAGPKVIDDLEQVQPGGEKVDLDKSVDVTLAVLSRPILVLLKFFQRYVHNWGLAIILLTLFIKLLTFYPTQKSLLSAKKMQKLGPKMAAIRKKYENDKPAPVGRDDEPVQGARRLAVRRLPAEPDPDADLDRALLDAELRRRAVPLAVHLPHPRPDGEGPVLHHAAAHGRRDVPADEDVAHVARQPAAGDDERHDADHVHGVLAGAAVGAGALHADQLPDRHPAAALRQPRRPQEREVSRDATPKLRSARGA